ncbi:hypothetical protein ACJX0J_011774, partial [Zea mays]
MNILKAKILKFHIQIREPLKMTFYITGHVIWHVLFNYTSELGGCYISWIAVLLIFLQSCITGNSISEETTRRIRDGEHLLAKLHRKKDGPDYIDPWDIFHEQGFIFMLEEENHP